MKIKDHWLQRQIAGVILLLVAAPMPAQTTQSLPNRQTNTAGQAQTTNQNKSGQKDQDPPEPVGIAVAPYEKPVGAASSRPAGAVIAPAKQPRAHSLLIKLGLIVGGAAAIGTVVALSKSNPSRPN